jgi:hypothetical protein
MHHSKMGGENAWLDNLVSFFHNCLEEAHLIDIDLLEAKPSWSNNRVGANGIAKRLDRFLIHEDILQPIQRIQSWVCSNECLDHFPILIELYLPGKEIESPFKYNPRWFLEANFKELVK